MFHRWNLRNVSSGGSSRQWTQTNKPDHGKETVMAARRSADAESRPIQPVKANEASHPRPGTGSGSKGGHGHSEFFSAKEPLPAGLNLHLETPVEGGSLAGREQLNQDILLTRSPDPNFARCWFSRPLDCGADSGNSAFWKLEKTARDTWLLCLQRVNGEVAAYHLKTTKNAFPITLKKGRVSKEFTNWPRSITVSWA
jgi:hypothetical protein